MPHKIHIQKLRYKWPGQTDNLLEIDSLSVEIGECLFLMGASGSGKSLLLSLLGEMLIGIWPAYRSYRHSLADGLMVKI